MKKRDHFPVTYSGLVKVDGVNEQMIGPIQAKLVFVGNITTGGFKIQGDDQTLFKIEWMQSMWFEFNDEKLGVRLNEKKQRTITFEDAEFYN